MRDLLLELSRRPAQLMHNSVDPGDLAPVAPAALRAEQLLQPHVAQHQHWMGLDHQLGCLVGHAPRFEPVRAHLVQELLLSVSLDQLLGVRWAEQLAPAGSAVSEWDIRRSY